MHQGMAPEAKEPTKTKVWSPVSDLYPEMISGYVTCEISDMLTRIRNYLYSFWALKKGDLFELGQEFQSCFTSLSV